MTRIAIGGFQHESHSFAPLAAGWAQFKQPGGFPALQHAATMLDALRPTSLPAAGAIAVAEAEGVAIAPLAWAMANPAGPVTRDAFERISALIVGALSDAMDEGPIDGVYLELHGAAASDDFLDAEGELLRRVRAVVGADIPITASLDPHANKTLAMVTHSDALVPYRTYPHIDQKATGALATQLLLRMIREGRRPAKVLRELDFWTPLPSQCTMVGPMAEVFAERARLEKSEGWWELGFCFGFPYVDFPGCGMAIAAYADTEQQADAAAEALAAFIMSKETDFASGVMPAGEGVARAIAVRDASGPIVLADTQDNPGGGGHGDTTGLLAELIRQDAQGAVLAPMNDAEAAAAFHAAGEGAEVTLDLGGKSDGAPLRVTALVEKLSDGKFILSGPMGKGNPADLGPAALIRVAPGVRVVVVSRKMQAHDQEIFRFLGIEPAEQKIVAVKSSVHFRAHFQPIASEVIVVTAPGPVVADPAVLPFTNLRPGLRLRPGDNRRTA